MSPELSGTDPHTLKACTYHGVAQEAGAATWFASAWPLSRHERRAHDGSMRGRKRAPGLDRREVVAGLAASLAGAVAWPVRGQTRTPTCVLTPQTEEGPFYFDPKLVRSDITERQSGVPLALEIRVVTAKDCVPAPRARIDVWHADARGVYSGYSGQWGTGEKADRSAPGKTFLRGTQFADPEGFAKFSTIYPSWYRTRTPHIHFKIFLEPREVAVSQLYLPDEISEVVFGGSADYRARRKGRDTYNDNDRFLRGRVGGAFCDVEKSGAGYRASVVIGISNA
jgi:protocatechuate 3,4-dioxygenase beta subunit